MTSECILTSDINGLRSFMETESEEIFECRSHLFSLIPQLVRFLSFCGAKHSPSSFLMDCPSERKPRISSDGIFESVLTKISFLDAKSACGN